MDNLLVVLLNQITHPLDLDIQPKVDEYPYCWINWRSSVGISSIKAGDGVTATTTITVTTSSADCWS